MISRFVQIIRDSNISSLYQLLHNVRAEESEGGLHIPYGFVIKQESEYFVNAVPFKDLEVAIDQSGYRALRTPSTGPNQRLHQFQVLMQIRHEDLIRVSDDGIRSAISPQVVLRERFEQFVYMRNKSAEQLFDPLQLRRTYSLCRA